MAGACLFYDFGLSQCIGQSEIREAWRSATAQRNAEKSAVGSQRPFEKSLAKTPGTADEGEHFS